MSHQNALLRPIKGNKFRAENFLSGIALICLLLLTTITNVWSQDIKVGVVTDQSGINIDISRDYVLGALTLPR